jgi:hypothetical protein
MYNPVKRMLRRTIGTRLTKIEDNSKTYNQINNEVVEKLTLSYDDDGRLYNVEGENVMVWDLVFDGNGRLESVLETNKVTDRAVNYDFYFDEEKGRLVIVDPTVLSEGTPIGYDEEDDDTSSYEPEVPDEDDIDLEPTTSGSVTDYDWTDKNGEGELM